MAHQDRIHDQFEQIAIARPALIAIREGHRTWTYAEIAAQSTHLAATILLAAGARTGPVAIYAQRSARLVVAMLACARAGMPFAVLDSAYPDQRIRAMADTVAPAVMITIDRAGQSPVEELGLEPALPVIAVDNALLSRFTGSPPRVEGRNDPIAYLLFTSGTTGKPNCIRTSHAPLVHFAGFYLRTFGPRPNDRFSLLGGLGHDPVLRDIFVPLSVGATICIPTAATLTNPPVLFRWVKSEEIAYMHATPQLLRLLCAGAQGEYAPALTFIFSGGDALKRPVVDELGSVAPSASIVNFYGSTETPQAVGYHIVDREDSDPIPIGKGIDDTQLLVLREDRSLAEPGELGEIAVRTHFLSEGYLNNAELTARRFIVSPFTGDRTDLLYLTGDYGLFREDGAVVVRGRMDDQVKIRGFRIETREISDLVEAIPGISYCIVLARPMPNGENMLVAYMAGDSDQSPSAEAVRERLTKVLPSYMVPARFAMLTKVPLLPNGKVDRAALIANAAVDALADEADASGGGQDPGDHPLTRDFAAIFGLARIDVSKSFDDLGGDSLSFIQASMAVEKALGKLPEGWETIPLAQLIEAEKVVGPRLLSINTSVIVRAISIVAIVLSHFSDMTLFGNVKSTSALFAMAGWSFATFQLGTILTSGRVKPVILTAISVAVPTVLYTGFIQFYQHKFYWPTLLLVHNFFGPDVMFYQGYWFLAALCQILVLLAALFSMRAVRDLAARNQFGFAATATLALLALSEILDWFWTPRFDTDRIFYHGICLVFVGISAALANGWRQKTAVAALTMGAAVVTESGYFPPLAILAVLAIDRVRLPALLVQAINLVAAGSLFIYLTHHGFNSMIISRTPLAGHLYASSAVAITGGVIIWRLWSMVWPRVSTRLFGH